MKCHVIEIDLKIIILKVNKSEMKKINILLIGTIFFLNAFAQHAALNDLVNIRLPKGSEKITQSQLQTFVTGKTAYSQRLKGGMNSNSDFYKINDMIIELNGAHGKAPKDYLEKLKKGLDGMARLDGNFATNYTSEIKNINNYRVLIIHDGGQNYASYSFYTLNSKNTSALNGGIDYDKTDKSNRDKAAKTLDEMLRGMTFK